MKSLPRRSLARWGTQAPRLSITASTGLWPRSGPAWSGPGSGVETCEPGPSIPARLVRNTRTMAQAVGREAVTHPAPELLTPLALGAEDPIVARHVADCATCQLEVGRLREAAGLLRGPAAFERLVETPECLDELAIADFVEGRLGPEARAPVVDHLLTCARCRSVVDRKSVV